MVFIFRWFTLGFREKLGQNIESANCNIRWSFPQLLNVCVKVALIGDFELSNSKAWRTRFVVVVAVCLFVWFFFSHDESPKTLCCRLNPCLMSILSMSFCLSFEVNSAWLKTKFYVVAIYGPE